MSVEFEKHRQPWGTARAHLEALRYQESRKLADATHELSRQGVEVSLRNLKVGEKSLVLNRWILAVTILGVVATILFGLWTLLR